jgi:Resolvase, N terminal domain
MTKITTEHLARSACVYIRQSTADQLAHNHESRRRQYGLVDRAKQLGWSNVEVIDDDLGRSGGGIARPGFERLLATICDGRVGAVLAIEASRLARNGRDWHTLIEFCGLVGTLIVDEDGIYDPRHPNDQTRQRAVLLSGLYHRQHSRQSGSGLTWRGRDWVTPGRTQVEHRVRFSNRPFEVKHFQTVRHCSVDVAHGLVLLFGIGTRALPSWDSRMR